MTTTALPAQTSTPTRRRFTVEEYCAMAEAGVLGEHERIELVDGEIVVMPPIGPPHESGADQLNRRLNYLLYDREVKLPRYAAGIPEVWIANVTARQVEAFHDPVDGVYQSSRIIPAAGSISPRAFPDVVLTVGEFLLGEPTVEGAATSAPGTNS